MIIWTYRWAPTIDGRRFEVSLAAGVADARMTVAESGAELGADVLRFRSEPYRLQTVALATARGALVFEVGPRNWLTYGLRVRRGDDVLFQSHDDPFAYYPRFKAMLDKAQTQRATGGGEDYDKLKRNAPAIITDIALGVLFFIAAKLTDLRTAALVAAGAGIALYGVQWVLDRVLKKKIDLLGGLALFGIVMLLISAGFSWLFDSELAVQLKSTYLGLLVAGFFALDGLRGGRYLGQRLSLYVAYNDVDVRRLAWSFAGVGAAMALVNAAVALNFSKDVWLWYTLWGDMVLAVGLSMWAIQRARVPTQAPAGTP